MWRILRFRLKLSLLSAADLLLARIWTIKKGRIVLRPETGTLEGPNTRRFQCAPQALANVRVFRVCPVKFLRFRLGLLRINAELY